MIQCGNILVFNILMFPEDCCTRLTCSIPALDILGGGEPVMEISINPSTPPVTTNIIVHNQNSVLYNMSVISTSQSIPIVYGSIFDTSINLLFNATDSYITVGVSFKLLINKKMAMVLASILSKKEVAVL